MKITTGIKKPKAYRIVVYGTEGIGKTTLASKLPGALFLDLENGTHGIDTACIDMASVTFESIMGTLNELRRDHQGYKTLILDSIDVMEAQLIRQICDEAKVDTLDKVGDWGKGFVAIQQRFSRILDKMSDLAESGMSIVCIGHSWLRTQTLPDAQGQFDRYELKLNSKVAEKVKEWCDTLLFINYKTNLVTVKGESKQKAEGGRRWVYAEHRPAFDAKHRASLPMPEDCPIDKAVEILCKALGEGKKAVEKKGDEVVAPSEPVAPAKAETAPATNIQHIESKLPDYVREMLALAFQYDIDPDTLEEWAQPKLRDKYGNDPIALKDWPKDFVAWVNRGMDKIAKKVLGK